MSGDRWHEVVRAFERGEVEGAAPGPFEREPTHGSLVLVSSDAVYKLKRPGEIGIADHGAVERRGELCRAEIELNRRLAPGVYHEALPVVATDRGFRLGAPGDEDVVEWVVVMSRFDRGECLHRRVDDRRVTVEEIERVARTIAAFHLVADPADPSLGYPETIADRLDGLCRTIHAIGGDKVDHERLDSVERLVRRWLDRHGERLRARADAGWVRDGHGDLRLEHVLLRPDGVEIVDCVEFDAAIRGGDVLADLSFLVMELEHAARHDLALALVRAWQWAGGPYEEDPLWLFAAFKALVRVETGLRRAQDLHEGDYMHAVVVDIVRTHLELAQRLAWRAWSPVVVVVSGLSGSGKTAASERLADHWGLELASSDGVRRRLVGVSVGGHTPAHAYLEEISGAVYERLGRLAGASVVGGRSIVVDATFRRGEDQRLFLTALRQVAGDDAILACAELVAPDELLRSRVAARERRGESDLTLEVLDAQLAARKRFPAPALPDARPIDTSLPLERVVEQIERLVLERLDGGLRPAPGE